MKPTSHTSPPATASDVDEKEQGPKLAWEKYSAHEYTHRPRIRSKSWLKYLWSIIPPMTSKSRADRYNYDYHVALLTDDEDMEGSEKSLSQRPPKRKRSKWLRYIRKTLLASPMITLSLFGLLHILFVLCSRQSPFFDPTEHDDDPNWTNFVTTRKQNLEYPTDITRDITPIPCHSHNDYWRTIPLFDALHWGCTSVEADVWLFPGEDELLVGHNTASLTRTRTFRSLYIDPLVDLLDRMNPKTEFNPDNTLNGVFDTNSSETLVLLVDFKTDGHDLFPQVLKQLEPLRRRDYLSYYNGKTFISRPITVVGTGNAPFDLLVSTNPNHREIFFDAPLDKLTLSPHRSQNPKRSQGQTGTSLTSPNDFNSSNSYYASVPFLSSIGPPWTGRLTSHQEEKLRAQIRGARSRGLKARYWDTPDWPTSLRNYIWSVLVEEGVDVLNVDDLQAAAKVDWGRRVRHGWFDG